jgi:UPF0755 protein
LRDIAELLHEAGIIENDKLFVLGVLANRANGKLKAGEYVFAAEDSMRTVMNALVSGRSVQYTVTFPEGMTTQQIVDRIKDNQVLVGEVSHIPAEGSLLPDTYSFTRGMERQKIIDRMREAQEKLLADLWPQRSPDLPVDQPYEAIILASIVEKETGVSSERARVAGVFVNRLRRNMRLQSDPTIIYGIVGGAGSLGRPITRNDIDGVTPYNTYHIDGLPPTPIANPGRAAIEAVLHPADTNDVYFVADGTGGHVFAETLEEHNSNVAQWRAIERERRAEEASTTATAPAGDTATTQSGSDASSADSGLVEAPADADTGAGDGASEQPAEAPQPADTAPQPADSAPPAPQAEPPAAATDSAQDASADAADLEDGTQDEAARTPEDTDYPLPEPKPQVPQRQGTRASPSDVTVMPLPATLAN